MLWRLLQRCDEPIPPAMKRFDIFRFLRVVYQRSSNLLYRVINGVLEIDDMVRPQILFDLVSGDQLTGMGNQQRQQSGWLEWQVDFMAILPELKSP